MKNIMIVVLTVCLASAGVASAATWKLVDDFSGTSVDTSIWDITKSGTNSTVTIESGRLHLYSPSQGGASVSALVTLKDTFSIDDSEDTGVFSLAFDAEMGASMGRPYGHGVAVKTVSDSATKASTSFYGGASKVIYLDNGATYGQTTLNKNFMGYPLHVQIAVSTSNVSFKVFNFKSGNAPADYTDTTATLADTAPGTLIGTSSLGCGIDTNSEELYLLLAGTGASTSYGTGDIYYDNVYTSIPEPATVGLLVVGGLLALVRRRRK